MFRAKYDIGLRGSARDHAVLRLPSRGLVTLLAILFLVSAQLCYAMAHEALSVQTVSDCHVNMSHQMDDTSVSADAGKTAPKDHGGKTPNACVMMTDFGLPPLVAALNGKSPNSDLRPPISLQA